MKKFWKIFLIESIFFAFALLLGIFVTLRLEELFQIAEAGSVNNQQGISPFGFLIYFILATAFVYFISQSDKFKKSRVFFFRLAFLFSVGLGGFLTLSTIVFEILALSIIVILISAWKRRPIILLHNFLVTISIAGIGAVIGRQFNPLVIAVLLTVFSVYDFIAVYKTKHMVKMASEMIKTKAIMGIIVPFSFSGLLTNLQEKEKEEFMVLGGGDLAFPLFLTSSVVLAYGLSEAIIVTVFALFGLFGSFYIFNSQKEKRAIPALPPIALGALVGYLLLLILM